MMHYREIQPPPALREFVRFFWILEQNKTPTHPISYKLFAEALPGLAFFHNSRIGVINGPGSIHRQFSITGRFKITGAFLYPYAVPLLFRLPSYELTNVSYDLSTFIGSGGIELQEKILDAQNDTIALNHLSEYLIHRLSNSNESKNDQHKSIRHIIQQPGQIAIETLAFQSGISVRQFERNTKHHTGFSPKLFNRLMRFQAALRLPQKQKTNSLTDLAYQAGYFDQSHFIREFREFSGITPKEYFNLKHEDKADTFVAWSPSVKD